MRDSARARLVEYAGLLHDVGRCVANEAFHKHTQYILLHAKLAGFSQTERLKLANLARYHRKSGPKSRHTHFMALPVEERERVKRLAILLRLANSLDRGHRGRVSALSARVEGDALQLGFRCEDDPALEVSSLQQHAGIVQTTLGLRSRWTPSTRPPGASRSTKRMPLIDTLWRNIARPALFHGP